jgi:uncharacterized membrane protein
MSPQAPRIAQENILAVARLEAESERSRSRLEKIADAIAEFTGSIPFVILHLVGFTFWVLINNRVITVVPAFDPFPFILLALIVSCEGVLLSTFVLIKQNRMSELADHRARLNLQVDLLSEKEITKLLQLTALICERLEIEEPQKDPEVQELSHDTAVDTLAEELKKVPTGGPAANGE